MDSDKGKFQFAGLKFLYDMELVDDPQLINNMKLNIFSISGSIIEVELLSSYQHRQMLVWLDLNWFGRTFMKDRIVAGVTERVQQLLPNFKFRVTTDRAIFDLSLERVKTILKGVPNEKVPSDDAGSTRTNDDSSAGRAEVATDQSGDAKDPDPESEGG